MFTIAILIASVCLIAWGIGAISRARIQATKTSVVEGTAARLIGVLLVLAIPSPYVTYGLLWCVMNAQGKTVAEDLATDALVVAPLIVLPLVAVIIGFASARPSEDDPHGDHNAT